MRHAKRNKLTHEDVNKALRNADIQVTLVDLLRILPWKLLLKVDESLRYN